MRRAVLILRDLRRTVVARLRRRRHHRVIDGTRGAGHGCRALLDRRDSVAAQPNRPGRRCIGSARRGLALPDAVGGTAHQRSDVLSQRLVVFRALSDRLYPLACIGHDRRGFPFGVVLNETCVVAARRFEWLVVLVGEWPQRRPTLGRAVGRPRRLLWLSRPRGRDVIAQIAGERAGRDVIGMNMRCADRLGAQDLGMQPDHCRGMVGRIDERTLVEQVDRG